jgi:WD40 repeat protein/tetratricopeptide (TPR) repeat protein
MSTNHLNRDALVVGICQYGDLPMSDQLTTLAKQAEQLAQLLETQGGFKVTRLPCAADLTLSLNKRVTLPELKQAIGKLLYPPAESPTQTALLFFAGHGLVEETPVGTKGYLATSETDGRSVYGFSLKDLRELLRHSSVKQQIVWLEACHSGALFTDIEIEKERDCCFVTAARANEEALAQGLLTNALLEILDYTHQAQDTPWVNSDTLIEGLRQKLITTEGWQRFEVQTQGHLMLTNRAFSQEIDPNAKPYKGLHYFDNKPEDALFFKGREKLITELLTKVTEKSFLAVLGASGNGKSSVIRAGVLYQLQQTGGCEIVNPFTPTANPLTALTNGLGTTEIVAVVNASTKARVILTIDQFEEVFSLCQDPQARDTFFNTLLDAVEQAAGKLCLIVVMRADFMDKCSNYPRLASYFHHSHIVTRPTEAEIQQIIEAPAKQAGFLVEPRLVAEMVTDFKDSLGGLPLLEFALTTLWEKGKADRLLRYADYQALGRIQGILEKKATDTYEDLTPAEQVVAKRVFLELTELGEGKPDTRRLVPQTDLLSFATRTASPSRTGSPEPSVEQVIAKLVKEHLIVTDKTEVTVVNIAHDALIEHWSVLRKWLDQSREDLKLQRQINEGAKAWKKRKKALLVGVDLARAEEYLGTHLERVPLSKGGVEFVKASLQARQRQRRWKQAVLATLMILMVIVGGGTYLYNEAKEQRNQALRTKSLFLKDLSLEQTQLGNTTEGVLLALEALPKSMGNPDKPYVVEAEAALYNAVSSFSKHIVLKGHKDEIYYSVFSPDGQQIATASKDHTARLWDAKTGKLLAILRHQDAVIHVTFSPDGQHVATASNDGTARLWEVSTGRQLAILEHQDKVWHVVFSPNGQRVVTASTDRTARVWEVNTGRQVWVLEGHEGHVNHVDFSSDGQYILTASRDKTARIWDANTGKLLTTLAGHKDSVKNAYFSPDGQHVVTTSAYDHTSRLWDVKTGRQLFIFEEQDNRAEKHNIAENELYASYGARAVFSPDGKKLLTMGVTKVSLWDTKTGKLLNRLAESENKEVDDEVYHTTFSLDGRMIATIAFNAIRLWDADTGKLLKTLPEDARHVSFSPDGHRLVTASWWDGKAHLWNINNGNRLSRSQHQEGTEQTFFSPDRALVASISKGIVTVSHVDTGKTLTILKEPHEKTDQKKEQGAELTYIYYVKFGHDSQHVVTASSRFIDSVGYTIHTVRLWNINTGKQVAVLRKFRNTVTHVAFSPDEKYIIIASEDNTARMSDVKTGESIVTFYGHRNSVVHAEFSPDGKYVITASKDNTACLWSVKTGRQLAVLEGHTGEVNYATFSPNGQRILTAASSGYYDEYKTVVHLWDTETGKQLTAFEHEGGVTHIEFSRDGQRVITTSMDGIAQSWRIFPTTQDLISYANQIVPHQLTCKDRQEFFLDTPLDEECCFVANKNIRGVYQGSCKDGKAHGFGKSIGRNTYEGEFFLGKMHGKGTYMWLDGVHWEGQFEKDKAQGLGVMPADWNEWNKLGNLLQGEYEWDKAIAAYKQQSKIDSNQVKWIWNIVGEDLGKLYKWDEAIAEYKKQIKVKPDHFWAWNNLGNALRSQGKLEEAIVVYRMQIKVKPYHEWAWYNLGTVLLMQGKLEEAIEAFREQVRIVPYHERAWNDMGYVLYIQGKLEEAIAAFKKQLEIDPKHEWAWALMGNALQQQGKLNEATAAFQKQTEVNPQNEETLLSIGKLLLRQLEVKHTDADTWKNLGVALWRLGHSQEEVASVFAKGLAVQTNHIYLLYDDAKLALIQGDINRCHARIAKALPLVKSNNQLFVTLRFVAWLATPEKGWEGIMKAIDKLDPKVTFAWNEWNSSTFIPVLKKQDETTQQIARSFITFFEGQIDSSTLKVQIGNILQPSGE